MSKPRSNLSVFGPNENKLRVTGYINLKLKFKENFVTVKAYIIKDLKVPLLRREEIRKLNLLKRVNQIKVKGISSELHKSISRVNIETYPELFNGLGKLKTKCRINLVENAKPISLNVPRVVPLPLMDKLKTELDRLVKLGVIEAVDFPTEWCSPIVCVPKDSASGIRLCCDYTV